MVCQRQTRGGKFRRLSRVILPVVVRNQERSITVAQLQSRIRQPVRDSRRREAGANTTHHDPVTTAGPPSIKPAITMLSPVPTKARGTNIGQLRGGFCVEVIDFNQGDT